MTNTTPILPTHAQVKCRARTLRARRAAAGHAMTHAQALERISQKQGYHDWNTLCAAITSARRGTCLPKTDTVRGKYLGNPFIGRVLRIGRSADGQTDLVLRFDAPMDVISHHGFSSMRQQVRCRLNAQGRSEAETSDGLPQMQIDL